jgi:hypothetical protein
VYIDPCSGARFDGDGRLVSGPAERGLDEFQMQGDVEGMVVDTRKLFCGAPYEAPPTPTRTLSPPTPTTTPTLPGPIVQTPAVAPPVVVTPTLSAQPTTPPSTPDPERFSIECERVSPDSKQR